MKFQQVVAILLSVEPVTAQKLRSLQVTTCPGKCANKPNNPTVAAEYCSDKYLQPSWHQEKTQYLETQCKEAFYRDNCAQYCCEHIAKPVGCASEDSEDTDAAIPAVTEASDPSVCESEIGEDAFLDREGRKKCSAWWTPDEDAFRADCADECEALTQGGKCLADENCESEGQLCKHHTGKCYTPDAKFEVEFAEKCTHKTEQCEITSSNHDYCCSQWGWCGNSDGHCTGGNYREKTFDSDKNGKIYLAEARVRHIARARQIAVQEAVENNTRWNITEQNKCGIIIPEIGDGNQFETCDPAGEAPCCSPYGWCQEESTDGGYWCSGSTPVSVKSVKGSINATNILYSTTDKFGCHLPKFNDEAKCNDESGCTWKSGKCETSQICPHNTDEDKCLNAVNMLEICSWKKKDNGEEYCHPNGFVNPEQAGRDCKDKWSDSQANCDDKWRCQWNENGTEDEKCEVAPKPTCEDVRNHKDKGHICKDATNNETCVNILKGKDLCEEGN